MTDPCATCERGTRLATEVARLQAKHRRYAEVTYRLLTEQARTIRNLRKETQ